MITAIDAHTALVLIDLQAGIVRMDLAHPIKDVLDKASQLVEAFRKEGLPIVVVSVNPTGAPWLKSRKDSPMRSAGGTPEDFADIVPEIRTEAKDIFVTKKTWNAFYNTALQDELERRGVTGIVIAGVSTSIGVEGTARAASERAYNISFATDAMTDGKLEAHENSIRNIFPRMGEVGTVADIIEKLKARV